MPVQLNIRWSLAVVLYISRKMFYFVFNRKNKTQFYRVVLFGIW